MPVVTAIELPTKLNEEGAGSKPKVGVCDGINDAILETEETLSRFFPCWFVDLPSATALALIYAHGGTRSDNPSQVLSLTTMKSGDILAAG
jgi:hypothetical protein